MGATLLATYLNRLYGEHFRAYQALQQAFRFALIAVGLTGLSMVSAQASPTPIVPTITIHDVMDYQKDKQLLIDSESTFNLPKHVVEAIDHEIPLSFFIEIELLEKSSSFGLETNRVRNRIEFHNEIRASGVNRTYTLFNSRNNNSQSFQSIESALKTLATIKAFPVASLSELHPKQRYTLRMRIKLDTLKLPAPLLLEAFFTDQWLLDSGWYETELQTPLSWQ